MATLAKIIITFITSLLFTSCYFDNLLGGKRGNGHVVTETRNLPETVTEIEASEGLNVYVTQGAPAALSVEADENIIHLIRTHTTADGTLRLYTERPIGRCRSKKIYVALPAINRLQTSSGAYLKGRDRITAEQITVEASSGSDLVVAVQANKVNCRTSSGADIELSGETTTLHARASSGSDIDAAQLTTQDCDAKASSGADIMVYASGEVNFTTSSGADITNTANPKPATNKNL